MIVNSSSVYSSLCVVDTVTLLLLLLLLMSSRPTCRESLSDIFPIIDRICVNAYCELTLLV